VLTITQKDILRFITAFCAVALLMFHVCCTGIVYGPGFLDKSLKTVQSTKGLDQEQAGKHPCFVNLVTGILELGLVGNNNAFKSYPSMT
jgi:hypothetical protein